MKEMARSAAEMRALVAQVSEKHNADVIAYSGPIVAPYDTEFIAGCNDRIRKPNVVLILTSHGGDAHVAYRIARCLQRKYDGGKFIAYIDTDCESAGTLLALGADEIVMSDFAQLGPIDVQLRKPNELFETRSGLTPTQALDTLKEQALGYVNDHFIDLKIGLDLTTQLALETATKLAVGLFQPVYAQIDPIQIGEIDRYVKIALEYGQRLGSKNLKDKALAKLVAGYPSHAFVIDREEAKELFRNVREPIDAESTLANALRAECRQQLRELVPVIRFLAHEFLHSAEEVSSEATEVDGRSAAGSPGVESAADRTAEADAPGEPTKIADLSSARTAKGA